MRFNWMCLSGSSNVVVWMLQKVGDAKSGDDVGFASRLSVTFGGEPELKISR